jgi:ABC-type nitrate/sulfonate/bicarbonate transport system substrate-binding protein
MKTIADLRGGWVGVSQIGDATHLYALDLIRRAHIPEKDVQIVVLGPSGRAAALASGRVSAVMLSAPSYFTLESDGYPVLANLMDATEVPVSNVLLAKKSTLARDPSVLKMLAKAHANAVARFYSDKVFAVQTYAKYDPQGAQGLDRVYDEYARRRAMEPIPFVPHADVEYFCQHSEGLDQRTVGQMIDNEVFDQLEKEGFFQSVFGSEIHKYFATVSAGAYR